MGVFVKSGKITPLELDTQFIYLFSILVFLLMLIAKYANKLYQSNEEYRKIDSSDNTVSPSSIVTSTGSGSKIGEELLVYHILSRLPVKSLMRFKCVCKHLKSVVENDSKFIGLNHAHLKKHPSVCMVLFEPPPEDAGWFPVNHRQMYLLAANLYGGGGKLSETTTVGSVAKLNRSSVPKLNLKPINGLICFFNTASEEEVDFSFHIYNIGTRESTPWIKSSMAASKLDTWSPFYRSNPVTYTFQFSVNPTTEEFKVICVWVIPRERARKKIHHADVVCEILTIGEGTWRRIDEVPTHVPTGDSVYVNGCIYWSNWWFKKQGTCSDQQKAVLVKFDVESEKFGTIPIPSFIADQIGKYNECYGHNYMYYFQNIVLLEVKGRLAILSRVKSHTVKLWMLEDNYKNNKQKRAAARSNGNCTEVIIELPCQWGGVCYDVRFHSVAGTSDGIILQVQLHNGMFFYFYSLEKKTLVEFNISGITSAFSNLHLYSMFTTFTESLLPISEEAPAKRCRDNQIVKRESGDRVETGGID